MSGLLRSLSIPALLAIALCALAQSRMGLLGVGSPGIIPVTVEATCTGTGSAFTVPCSGAMTVAAGDVIACGGSGNNFDPVGMYFSDTINGTYDTVEQIVHPNSANAEVITAVFQNSAGGSITPQLTNWESITLNFRCYALKGARASLALDGGGVNLTRSATATNPTSGTAAAPTNANEIVVGTMVRPTTATITGDAAWTPGGTLTASGSSFPVYNQYQIQTTAVTANDPMTATSAAFINSQFAVLNSSNPSGSRSFTGVYGVPAIAKTNAASTTVADLNGATTTLRTVPDDGTGWVLNAGLAVTYTTAIAPTGTGSILLQGTNHTFGDAGTSISFPGANTTTEYLWGGKALGVGHPMWLSGFLRIGSTSIVSGQLCDNMVLQGGVTDSGMTLQTLYDSTTKLSFLLEPLEGGSSLHFTPSGTLNTDVDFRPVIHMAGTNEQNHQLLIQQKSGAVWSTTDTFNYPVLCTVTAAALCDTAYLAAHAQASGTGSASSGSTALTVTSITGSIVVGQIVTGTGIAWPTAVSAVTGGAVTLSQNTSGAVSGTVTFNTKPANLVSATKATVTGGSTAMTITAATFGTPAVGQPMGGSGLAPGTIVAAVSGTSVTLSQPAISTMASGAGVTFWSAGNALAFGFGKYSSCNIASAVTMSGFVYDPFNDWGAFLPN